MVNKYLEVGNLVRVGSTNHIWLGSNQELLLNSTWGKLVYYKTKIGNSKLFLRKILYRGLLRWCEVVSCFLWKSGKLIQQAMVINLPGDQEVSVKNIQPGVRHRVGYFHVNFLVYTMWVTKAFTSSIYI